VPLSTGLGKKYEHLGTTWSHFNKINSRSHRSLPHNWEKGENTMNSGDRDPSTAISSITAIGPAAARTRT